MTLGDRLRAISNTITHFEILDNDGELVGINAAIAVGIILLFILIVGVIQ